MPLDMPAPPDREQALQDAILSYLKAVDAGQPPEPREFMARHPDLSGELDAFFADQAQLGKLVAPLRGLAQRAVEPASAPEGGDPHAAGATSKGGTDCQPRRNTESFHGGDSEPASSNGPPAIPGYEILRPIKRGGMGIVYKARQVRLNRVVALKVIRSRHQPNGAEQARFHAEAQTVARLDDP